MADTALVSITTTAWAELTATTALITNESDNPILVREAASAPSASVITGHTLNPRQSLQVGVLAALGVGQEVYGRAISAASVVAVTEGGGLG